MLIPLMSLVIQMEKVERVAKAEKVVKETKATMIKIERLLHGIKRRANHTKLSMARIGGSLITRKKVIMMASTLPTSLRIMANHIMSAALVEESGIKMEIKSIWHTIHHLARMTIKDPCL